MVVRIRPTRVRLFLFISIRSIRVRLLRQAVMGVMDRVLSRSAIKAAAVPQVMALRLRLHLAKGEGQLHTRCQRANLLAPVLEDVNYEPYALFATHDKEVFPMDFRKELPRKLMRGVSQPSPTKRCQRNCSVLGG